jgi:2'-5' RNA ligase
MGLRVFLAVPVADEAVLSSLRALLSELRSLRGVRAVPPHQLHFTLRFFEDLQEERLPAVRRAAEYAAAHGSSFSLSLSGLGMFPPNGPPRVLWVGCGEGGERLSSLARDVDSGFTFEGFSPEVRPFSSHLTLARVKDPRAARAASSFAAARASFDAGTFEVRELVLFQSVLGRDGASHTPLGRFALAFAPP